MSNTNSLGGVQPTQAEMNMSYANAGISALSSVVNSSLAIGAYKTQVKAETDARIANMDSVLSSYEYEAYKIKEAEQSLDFQYANKVSESTLDTLKQAAYAKVAAAETGTSGGSTNEVIDETYVQGQLNVAIINRERALAKQKLLSQAEISKQNAISSFESLASGTRSYQANSLLNGLSGFSSALGGILTTMPDSVKASFYSVETSSKTNGNQIANNTKVE